MITTASFVYNDTVYEFSPAEAIDISISLGTAADQVNCYYAEAVRYETIAVGDFVGSTRAGGSCNYQRVSFTPHGNGTHTECYGHISDDGATIHDCLRRYLFLARLCTVAPAHLDNGDNVVRLADLQAAVGDMPLPEALIIRTLPNTPDKLHRQYSGTNPPYLEPHIGQWLAAQGVQHLLLDLPSVDKEWDNGALSAHRAFWGLPPRHKTIDKQAIRRECTITELVWLPDEVPDGDYLLNLQIIGLHSDASPSKPILYKISKKK